MDKTGQRIGPFLLKERIGASPGTSIYRAERVDGQRDPMEVGIRVADDPSDMTAAGAVRIEYEVLKTIRDPRVPEDVGYFAGEAALATKWYAGITLADIIEASRRGLVSIDVPTLIDVAHEVAQGLRAAHEAKMSAGSTWSGGGPATGGTRGVVHSHIAPERIALTPKGKVIILGFGTTPWGRRPAYTSPEQAGGEVVDERADQWGLGAIILEMLIGEPLYGSTFNQQLAAMEGDAEPNLAKADRLHPELARVLRRMLAPRPKDRYGTDAEVIRDLLAAGRGTEGVASRQSLVSRVMPHRALLLDARPTDKALPTNKLNLSGAPARSDRMRRHALPSTKLSGAFSFGSDEPEDAFKDGDSVLSLMATDTFPPDKIAATLESAGEVVAVGDREPPMHAADLGSKTRSEEVPKPEPLLARPPTTAEVSRGPSGLSLADDTGPRRSRTDEYEPPPRQASEKTSMGMIALLIAVVLGALAYKFLT